MVVRIGYRQVNRADHAPQPSVAKHAVVLEIFCGISSEFLVLLFLHFQYSNLGLCRAQGTLPEAEHSHALSEFFPPGLWSNLRLLPAFLWGCLGEDLRLRQ